MNVKKGTIITVLAIAVVCGISAAVAKDLRKRGLLPEEDKNISAP